MAIDELNTVLDKALKIIKQYGPISVSLNEVIKIGEFNIPKSYAGEQVITADYTLVNNISRELGCLSSFFHICPEGLLRISTNLKDSAGNNAIGTLIDNSHPICISIKSGKKEKGRSWIINDFFETVDIPILDKNDRITLAFGLGKRETSGEREIILFQLGGNIYGINIMFTSEIIRMPEKIIHTSGGNKYIVGVFSLKNEVIPIIDAMKLCGFDILYNNLIANKSCKVLIVFFEGKKYGVIVDRVIGLAKYNLSNIERVAITEMDLLSSEMITGILPEIKNYKNVIIISADKLIQIASNTI